MLSIRLADSLWQWLRQAGIGAGRYYGELRTAEREETQQAFMKNDSL